MKVVIVGGVATEAVQLLQLVSEDWMKKQKLLYLNVPDIFPMQTADFHIISEM